MKWVTVKVSCARDGCEFTAVEQACTYPVAEHRAISRLDTHRTEDHPDHIEDDRP